MDRYEKEISRFCDELKRDLLRKYRRGRAEHGGTPSNIECQKEINLEVLDILNYHLIDKVNGSSKKNRRR